MNRRIQDASLSTTKALPSAGATNYHDAIDLKQTLKGALEAVELVLSVPAITALVEDKVVTFEVQDSANGTDFTDLGIEATITGGYGGGSDAQEARFSLPSTCRRYIRVSQTVPADAGTLTAVTTTVALAM